MTTGNHPHYEKPWLSLDEQCTKLKAHGMQNVEPYRNELSQIGYYRLSGFWYMFRKIDKTTHSRSSDFMYGSDFRDVLRIYNFDQQLRSQLFSAIASLEISLRSRLAYTIGKQDPFLYLKPKVLDPALNAIEYGRFITKFSERQNHSREDFVKHFRHDYDGEIPIWAATEIMEFAMLRNLYSFLPYQMRTQIAITYGADQATLKSWLNCLNFIRNLCAHHGRLYNRSLIVTPSITPAISLLEHAIESSTKMYGGIAVLVFLLSSLNAETSLRGLLQVLSSIPGDIPQVDVARSMGIPANWQQEKIWQVS
ncbi:Abi family protein [Bifidobacterium sp. ESL0775]|uniref:Abi family protein n=1 Tax=Bifidobacterium sp. ESL0775 TaxID=2983230 RepID=UPI0023F6BDD4|nr:Abi family protein [Bifidobacterium sp. ESL0775]WEV69919.1 Abi family protein [Bifidobacterium sp. ESL0775]